METGHGMKDLLLYIARNLVDKTPMPSLSQRSRGSRS